MAAGFGGGIMYALVRGNRPAGIIVRGVYCGFLNVGLLKVIEMLAKEQEEDLLYNETRWMLSTLDQFEKNFKKGILIDNTLPLLTDSILQKAKIPAGPRLRILDHIKREKKASQEAGGDLTD